MLMMAVMLLIQRWWWWREEDDDVDVEEEEDDEVEEEDVEEEDRSQDREAHCVLACAVERHMDISQEPRIPRTPQCGHTIVPKKRHNNRPNYVAWSGYLQRFITSIYKVGPPKLRFMVDISTYSWTTPTYPTQTWSDTPLTISKSH